jgi:Mg2+-importing ATPase
MGFEVRHNIQNEELGELIAHLQTSQTGLSSEEAERRLKEFGYNEFVTIRLRSKVLEIVRATTNPVVAILLVAAVVSAFLGATTDAAIIAAMVILSATINFWQTFRSARAVKRLREQITPSATVRRDGQWVDLPRREVVIGDIVKLISGDLVPADCRLTEAVDLHVQQGALTGESLPTEKYTTPEKQQLAEAESPGFVFLGTSIVSGTAQAVVFATGKNTSFGEVVEQLAESPEETEFERGMRRFGLLVLQTVTFLVLFILVANIGLGRDAFQSLLFSVALAVGLTPEFLPMITTVTLAQGAIRMAKEKVIVKHLSAIQNLGSIDILCSDKTGTLTTGSMSFDSSIDPLGTPSGRALALAYLNSQFETGIKSPLDAAILEQPIDATEGFQKTDEIPFDFDRRRLSVVVKKNGVFTFITKGAPENVISICSTYEINGESRPIDETSRKKFLDVFCELSQRGFRVLAVAYRTVDRGEGFKTADEHDLVLVGFITFADHLLDGISDSINSLSIEGVRVKILTGDNELVTRHICNQVGIDAKNILLGHEIALMDEMTLAKAVEEYDIFARVSPIQKHRIIGALRSKDHVVGFLGDGINDAPSLHAADVGISVAGAVDVARESSDIILLERRLDVLHSGILAGRQAFGNVFKYLLMGTSSNFGNMFSMAGAALFLPFLPMLPTQILLNNFLYDLAQITIPTDNIDPIYVRKPQRWNVKLVRNFMLLIGPVSSIFDFLTFFALLRFFHFDERLFQTGWFVESLTTQTLVLFIIRTIQRPWRNRPSIPLTVTTLAVVAVGAILPFSPFARLFDFGRLPAEYFLFLAIVTGIYLTIVELVKGRILRKSYGGSR